MDREKLVRFYIFKQSSQNLTFLKALYSFPQRTHACRYACKQ